MWDKSLSHPFTRATGRNFLITFALLLATFISAIVLTVQPSAAATDASWDSSGRIVYKGDTYDGPMTDSDMPNVVPSTATSAYVVNNDSADAKIIYFPKGSADTSATSAEYITAKFHKDTGKYSDPSPPKTISINAQPAQEKSDGSGCEGAGAIGWVVCPVSDRLAHGVDYLYSIVASFLQVEPLSNSQDNVIYQGWEYMRNFANIAFILAFMIIIYSQITGAAISNYGIKKMLPRLLFAAILMNVSYWVCALGVDISNFLGVSLENLFMGLRDGLMSGHAVQVTIPTWGEITAAILGLGTVGVAGAAIVITSGGVLALLIPMLVGVALSALVAIIILAARQAILVIMIIISPLAFVAFLLPNTEKYFKKWGDTYSTLLLMFPIFSVLFGGAQLAGGAIILSAHNIVELLFGMAIQVIPLAITPLLIKLSTSSLSQVAGFVNNPKRGVVDRSRNWAKQFNEDQRERGMKYNVFAQKYDHRKRAKEDRRKSTKAANDNLYHKSAAYKAIDQTNRAIEREQKRIEGHHDLEWNVKLKTDRHQFEKEMEARVTLDQANAAKGRIDSAYEDLKSGTVPSNLYPSPHYRRDGTMLRIRDAAGEATRDIALTGMHKQMAERAQHQQLSEDLKHNIGTIDGMSIRQYAGGVMGDAGQNSVEATAKSTVSKYMIDDINNIRSTMDYNDAKDNKKLMTMFEKSTTMAQRVAYTQAMAKNGGPGNAQMRKAFEHYETTIKPNDEDMSNYKELVATDGAILAQGKDIEFWLTKQKDSTGRERKFKEITEDKSTWNNLSPAAFAQQNATSQSIGFNVLRKQPDKTAYFRVIDGIRNNPAALANVKEGIVKKYSIYSDAEIAAAAANGKTLPTPGDFKP